MTAIAPLVLSSIVLFDIARRGMLLSPVGIFISIALATEVVFTAIVLYGVFPSNISHWWQISGDYRHMIPLVMSLYLGLCLLAWGAGVSVVTSRSRQQYKKLGVHNSPALPKQSAPLELFDSRLLYSLLLLLLLACVAHFMSIDINQLWNYREYLSIREPAVVGLSFPPLRMFHVNLNMLGCLVGVFAALSARYKQRGLLLLSGAIFIYCFAMSCAFASRFAALQLVLISFVFFVTRRTAFDPRAILFLILSAAIYSATISLRQDAGIGRVNEYGLMPMIRQLFSMQFLLEDFWLFSLFNNFGGGFVVAEAWQHSGVDFPIKYKLLSFSPLPSILDGFNEVRWASGRVSTYGPYSNFAELYHFGPFYFIGFVGFLFWVLRKITFAWANLPPRIAILATAPAYYAFLGMHYYPLRMTTRWLIVSVLVSIAAQYYVSLRGKRSRFVMRTGLLTGFTPFRQKSRPFSNIEKPGY
jgi:hypothetical protein